MSDEAKELLANSYYVSAERILQAIDGRLQIRNSRAPDSPPTSANEVVGLCGQRGRHPYFRIPLPILYSALNRIIDSRGNPSIELQILELSDACSDLRRQTYFDNGTGCVNDRVPSMVPLLPPEEIWLDGKELPLDIWRLISFELDLVSSGVSSPVAVEDFAFSAVSPNALAFRYLLGQLGNRRIQFRLDLQKIPSDWMGTGRVTRTIDVSLARLFFESGALLTPLATQDFIKWYEAIRYLHWIDETQAELRVKDEFRRDSVDCRYRGLFAEETAVGLMAVILGDVFDARPINNTVGVLPAGTVLDPNKPIADFVALSTNPVTGEPTTIIAESKGSLGNKVSKSRRDRAKEQVDSTNAHFAGTSDTLGLKFASTIRYSAQGDNTHCLVIDPPIDARSEPIYIDPVGAYRTAYAKTLRFAGLDTAARQVIRGEAAGSIRSMDDEQNSSRRRNERDFVRMKRTKEAYRRFNMELILDVGPCALAVDPQIANLLRHGINNNSIHAIPEILGSRRRQLNESSRGASFETSLGIGCAFYSDLDEPPND